MVLFHVHTGHVVFSNITNLSKSEHDMCHIIYLLIKLSMATKDLMV